VCVWCVCVCGVCVCVVCVCVCGVCVCVCVCRWLAGLVDKIVKSFISAHNEQKHIKHVYVFMLLHCLLSKYFKTAYTIYQIVINMDSFYPFLPWRNSPQGAKVYSLSRIRDHTHAR